MSYEATLIWPYPAASNVFVTGTFDNWSCTQRMQKTSKGFTATVRVPYASKVLYKFVVDGQWLTNMNLPTELDGWNLNNVLKSPPAPPPPTPPKTPIEDVFTPTPQVAAVQKEPPVPVTPVAVDPPVELVHPTTVAAQLEKAIIAEEPPKDVPVVEQVKPVELPVPEQTGADLRTGPILPPRVIESIEISEQAPVSPAAEDDSHHVHEGNSIPPHVDDLDVTAPAEVLSAPPVAAPVLAPVVDGLRPSTPPPRAQLPVEPTTPISSFSPTVVSRPSAAFTTSRSSIRNGKSRFLTGEDFTKGRKSPQKEAFDHQANQASLLVQWLRPLYLPYLVLSSLLLIFIDLARDRLKHRSAGFARRKAS